MWKAVRVNKGCIRPDTGCPGFQQVDMLNEFMIHTKIELLRAAAIRSIVWHLIWTMCIYKNTAE